VQKGIKGLKNYDAMLELELELELASPHHHLWWII
jgi:hypothetical protein